MDQISPSCIACEMILAMLCNLLCASSLMASCFSCFTVKVLKDFRVMTVARERSRLVSLRAIKTDRATPLANAAIEIPPVVNFDVIKPVFTVLVIILNRVIFLAIRSRTSISSSRYASISVNFFKRYFCSSCGVVGFKSGYILLVSSLSYMLIYSIVKGRMSSG